MVRKGWSRKISTEVSPENRCSHTGDEGEACCGALGGRKLSHTVVVFCMGGGEQFGTSQLEGPN